MILVYMCDIEVSDIYSNVAKPTRNKERYLFQHTCSPLYFSGIYNLPDEIPESSF